MRLALSEAPNHEKWQLIASVPGADFLVDQLDEALPDPYKLVWARGDPSVSRRSS